MTASGEGAVELQQLVAELLGRFGVAGTVTVDGGRAILSGSGPAVEIDVGSLLTGWSSLTLDDRRRRALEAARGLAGERRRIGGDSRAPRPAGISSLIFPIACVTAIAAAGAMLWALRSSAFPTAGASARRPTPAVDYDAEDRERRERATRVCDATRSRVMRGAAVGPSDAEGWVVEIAILKTKGADRLASDPALATFVRESPKGGRIVWPGAGPLLALEGPDTTATVLESDLPEAGDTEFRGLNVVLAGRYVAPYFDDAARVTYVRFAIAFSDALHAEYAAMYARCATGTAHHLGSFFRGPTPGGAVASVLYFIGASGDVPDVRRSLLSEAAGAPADPPFAFKNLLSATAPLKKARVMAMVGAEGGMISGLDDQPSTISFPPRDANRAARASHEIARELDIAEDR